MAKFSLYKSALLSTMLLAGLLLSASLVPFAAQAQKAAASAPAPTISGTTLDKKAFQLNSFRGKVVLVMFWSTDCAVCRDKMPELRKNVQGWADQPFELVLVSTDQRMADVEGYNNIIHKSVPMKQRFTQLWSGETGYKDNLGGTQLQRSQLPVTLLIDKKGKLVERFEGRVPAEAWDRISDLL